jgi:nucleoside phosphorylase
MTFSVLELDRPAPLEEAFAWMFAQVYFNAVSSNFDQKRIEFAQAFVIDDQIARALVNRIDELGSQAAVAAGKWIDIARAGCATLANSVRDLPRSLGFPDKVIAAEVARTYLRVAGATHGDVEAGLHAQALDAIAELATELALALPPFDPSNPKASRQRLSHFTDSEADALVQRVKRIELQSALGGRHGNPQWAREEASYRLAIPRELDYVELFGADLSPESTRQGLTVAYVSLSLRDLDGKAADARAPMLVEELLSSLDSSKGRLLIRGAAGAGKSTLFRWIAIRAAAGWESHRDEWGADALLQAFFDDLMTTSDVSLSDLRDVWARLSCVPVSSVAPLRADLLQTGSYWLPAKQSLRLKRQPGVRLPVTSFDVDTKTVPRSALGAKWFDGTYFLRSGAPFYSRREEGSFHPTRPGLVIPYAWHDWSGTRGWRRRTPFLLRLRDFPRGHLPTPDELPAALTAGFGKPPAGLVESILSAGEALILFDGVDELPPACRQEVSARIEQLIERYPDNYILLSTRPEAVPDGWLSHLRFREAWIEPLSERDKREFIDNWHRAVADQARAFGKPADDLPTLAAELKSKLPSEPGIARLAEVPLLCAMICALHRDRRQKLPESQAELCDALCHMLLHRRERESGLDLSAFPEAYRTLTYEQKRAIVKELAHYMVDNDLSSIEKPTAVAGVQRMLSRFVGQDPAHAGVVCESIVERSGMLREVSPGRIDFIHNTFKEYLAAERFADEGSVGRLMSQAFDPAWQSIVVFAAASRQSEFATRLMTELLKRSRHRLAARPDAKSATGVRACQLLALRCRQVAVQLAPELIKQLDDVVFELFPPRTMADAEVLASGGDLAVQHLRYDARRPAQVNAACARTLRLIGTAKSTERLAAYRADRRAPVVAELLNVIAPFELEAVRAALMGGERLSASVASYIERLDGIEALGIGSTLDLSGTRIASLEPLSKCPKISTLVIEDVVPERPTERGGSEAPQSLDISAVASLPELRSLSLASSVIRDFAPLAEARSLRDLAIDNTSLTSLSSLTTLDQLESLRLTRLRGPFDVSGIGNLRSLKQLDLSGTDVRDLGPLAELKELQELRLGGVPADDFSALGSLRSLQRLAMEGTRPRDIGFLDNLDALKEFHVHAMRVDDVTRLESASRAKGLSLVGVPMTGGPATVQTPTQRTPIDVAVIVALGEEFDELDKSVIWGWTAVPSTVEGDYDYRFSRKRANGSGHDECVAVLVGEMGTEATAIRVASLLMTYAARTLFIVGIAGALRDDVQVGDVVVGEFVDLYLANSKAVSGRRRGTYQFERAPDPYRSSEQWVRAARNLPYAHKQAVSAWKRNGRHEFRNQVPDQRRRLRLIRKALVRSEPSYLVAPVASGPTVVASDAFRKWIQGGNRRYGAVEMESGGFLKAVQQLGRGANAIVVRGISDLADDRKKDFDKIGKGGLRRVAMRNALEFVWLLLDYPPGSRASRTPDSREPSRSSAKPRQQTTAKPRQRRAT